MSRFRCQLKSKKKDGNGNVVNIVASNECSTEIENHADGDCVPDPLPVENAVIIAEPNEIEAEIRIDETPPADNASDAECDNTNHRDTDLEIDENERLLRRHLRKPLRSMRAWACSSSTRPKSTPMTIPIGGICWDGVVLSNCILLL